MHRRVLRKCHRDKRRSGTPYRYSKADGFEPKQQRERAFLRSRFGEPPHVEITRYGNHYFWTQRQGPRRTADLHLTRECLREYCLSQVTPSSCPSSQVYKGVVLMVGFNRGVKDHVGMYLTLSDYATWFTVRYQGRRSLPPRGVCPLPVP
jgi:hypothetical protein